MSKFALEGFSQCVREELRDRKIRVINVYPAATATDIWDQIEGKWPRKKMMSATRSRRCGRVRPGAPDGHTRREYHALESRWKSVSAVGRR